MLYVLAALSPFHRRVNQPSTATADYKHVLYYPA